MVKNRNTLFLLFCLLSSNQLYGPLGSSSSSIPGVPLETKTDVGTTNTFTDDALDFFAKLVTATKEFQPQLSHPYLDPKRWARADTPDSTSQQINGNTLPQYFDPGAYSDQLLDLIAQQLAQAQLYSPLKALTKSVTEEFGKDTATTSSNLQNLLAAAFPKATKASTAPATSPDPSGPTPADPAAENPDDDTDASAQATPAPTTEDFDAKLKTLKQDTQTRQKAIQALQDALVQAVKDKIAALKDAEGQLATQTAAKGDASEAAATQAALLKTAQDEIKALANLLKAIGKELQKEPSESKKSDVSASAASATAAASTDESPTTPPASAASATAGASPAAPGAVADDKDPTAAAPTASKPKQDPATKYAPLPAEVKALIDQLKKQIAALQAAAAAAQDASVAPDDTTNALAAPTAKIAANPIATQTPDDVVGQITAEELAQMKIDLDKTNPKGQLYKALAAATAAQEALASAQTQIAQLTAAASSVPETSGQVTTLTAELEATKQTLALQVAYAWSLQNAIEGSPVDPAIKPSIADVIAGNATLDATALKTFIPYSTNDKDMLRDVTSAAEHLKSYLAHKNCPTTTQIAALRAQASGSAALQTQLAQQTAALQGKLDLQVAYIQALNAATSTGAPIDPVLQTIITGQPLPADTTKPDLTPLEANDQTIMDAADGTPGTISLAAKQWQDSQDHQSCGSIRDRQVAIVQVFQSTISGPPQDPTLLALLDIIEGTTSAPEGSPQPVLTPFEAGDATVRNSIGTATQQQAAWVAHQSCQGTIDGLQASLDAQAAQLAATAAQAAIPAPVQTQDAAAGDDTIDDPAPPPADVTAPPPPAAKKKGRKAKTAAPAEQPVANPVDVPDDDAVDIPTADPVALVVPDTTTTPIAPVAPPMPAAPLRPTLTQTQKTNISNRWITGFSKQLATGGYETTNIAAAVGEGDSQWNAQTSFAKLGPVPSPQAISQFIDTATSDTLKGLKTKLIAALGKQETKMQAGILKYTGQMVKDSYIQPLEDLIQTARDAMQEAARIASFAPWMTNFASQFKDKSVTPITVSANKQGYIRRAVQFADPKWKLTSTKPLPSGDDICSCMASPAGKTFASLKTLLKNSHISLDPVIEGSTDQYLGALIDEVPRT